MSIEQTTQLIQLILNAVLMLGACGVMLCAALMHQMMLENRSRSGNLAQRWSPTDHRSSVRHQLFRQQRQTRRSVFWLSGACWVVGMSCGALVLRSVWQVNELIGLSLVLFAGACGLFLVGTGCLIVSVMGMIKDPAENRQLVRSMARSNQQSGAKSSPKVVDFRAKRDERSGRAGDRKRP
jgi:hypothetical protein